MTKMVNFFIGAFAGLLAGGLASLLLAPKSGFEFRREIQNDYDDFIKQVEAVTADEYILLE